MNHLEVFLHEHASVHFKDGAPSDMNVDWLLTDLDDRQIRARPHGMNSIAWLLWHVARVEDACVSRVVMGQSQLLDSGWVERLCVGRQESDGEGMTEAQVAALSESVDLTALRDYRNAVCRRTRVLASGLWPERWHEPLTEGDSGDMPWLIGKPRAALLSWWAVQHSHYHIGQAAMVRRIVST